MWGLPGPGIEPVSPALAGGFLTTRPPGKSRVLLFTSRFNFITWILALAALSLNHWFQFGILNTQPNEKLIDSQWNLKYSHCSFKDGGKNLKRPKHCKARRNYLSSAKYFFDAHLLSYCVLGHGHTRKSKMLSLFSWSSKAGGGPTWKQATAIWHHVSCEGCDGSTEPWGSTAWR